MYVKQDLILVKKSEKRVIGSRLWSKFQLNCGRVQFSTNEESGYIKNSDSLLCKIYPTPLLLHFAIKKNQQARFNAFPRRGIGRRQWISECGVDRAPGQAVFG